MIIELSKGQLHLNKLTRGVKRKINAEMFKNVSVSMSGDPSEMQDQIKENKIPMQNLLDSSEKAIELLINKIMIDKRAYNYGDLDNLEKDGLITEEDISLIEKSIEDINNGVEVKKN